MLGEKDRLVWVCVSLAACPVRQPGSQLHVQFIRVLKGCFELVLIILVFPAVHLDGIFLLEYFSNI